VTHILARGVKFDFDPRAQQKNKMNGIFRCQEGIFLRVILFFFLPLSLSSLFFHPRVGGWWSQGSSRLWRSRLG